MIIHLRELDDHRIAVSAHKKSYFEGLFLWGDSFFML